MILYAVYVIALILVLVDVITRDNSLIRYMPKVTWVFIVIFLPLVGSVLWFAVGRDYVQRDEVVSFGDPRRTEAAMAGFSSTEAELAAIDAEIAYFEKQERIRRLEAELKARGVDPKG